MDEFDTPDFDAPAAVDRLVDEYRITCLWFLRPDYYPTSHAERINILEQIQRHGDRPAYRRAGRLRQWLLLNSSAASVGS